MKSGAVATIFLSVSLAAVLLCGSNFEIERQTIVLVYLAIQLLSGIPFALTSGVDLKLSGIVFRRIGLSETDELSPIAEIRRCKAAGSTAAAAIGTLIWCLVILMHPRAINSPGWYSVLFLINTIPALLLIHSVTRLQEHVESLDESNRKFPLPSDVVGSEKSARTEIRESIVAIGCLEGLLQFSQFYFSIAAIKALFQSVPTHRFLFIAIPFMFYLVNGVEQIGALLFSKCRAVWLCQGLETRLQGLKLRQYASLTTLFVAAGLFALHLVIGRIFNWNGYLDVAAYGVFNVIKGFAGALSDEWNESIVNRYPDHDDARFTTISSLFSRTYQIASIACFIVLNQLPQMASWRDGFTLGTLRAAMLHVPKSTEETGALVGTLTVFIFGLLGANILAYSWIGNDGIHSQSIWNILLNAVVQREQRTALFTQFLRVLFVVSLIMANVLSLKVFNFKGLIFTHGSVFYITLFVLLNLITVFEDIEAAVKTVFLGMISYVSVYLSLVVSANVGGQLVDPGVLGVGGYNDLLMKLAHLFVASFYGYVVTVVLNVGLLTLLSRYFQGRSALVLGAVVTFVCQVIDTLIFVWVGFAGERNVDLPSILVGQFSLKFSIYLVMYFPLYFVIQGCKKWIGIPSNRFPGLTKESQVPKLA